MDGGRLLAFSALAAVLIAVPGPSVLFIVSRAISRGRRAALETVLGNALGEFCQVLLVALGLGQLLERSALAFTVVKLVGAAYLCFLALATWRSGRLPLLARPAAEARGGRRILLDGFLVGASNPKSMVFIAAVLPSFADPQLGHLWLQLLLLGLTWVAIALCSDSVWGLAAGSAGAWLEGRPSQLRRAHRASALIMLGLGLGLAVSSRSSG